MRGGVAAGQPALTNVIVLSAVAGMLVTVWILVDLHGWSYYRTPLRIRGYAQVHTVLRPSGSVGRLLGLTGFLMMLVPVVYSVRRKWRRLANLGSLTTWLEVHIFCGVVGPVMVTFHTAGKFNGAISVAYWSMVAVVVSGFVGRYLYVRIPKTIRGTELTHAEIARRADALKAEIAGATLSVSLLQKIEEFESAAVPRPDALSVWSFLFGQIAMRLRLRRLRRDVASAGVEKYMLDTAASLVAERAMLLRRLAYLNRTRMLFAMWHVFHQPLVYLMFAIALLHIGVAVYFGYAFV